jgi:parallel beta-helix repeat protein
MWSSGATLLALLLVFVRPALGDPCVLTMGSQYQLKSDTVDWTMQTSSGQSCIRGLRHNRVTIDTAKLISAPQSGQVKLLGPGFSYTAKSDFEGQDSFTIQVSGMLNGIRGSSEIRIIVSVGPNVSPQTSPTERSDRPPGDLSSAAQPNKNPTSVASPAVNGVCGSANGVTATTAPTAGLCTAGGATTVTGTGPWAWMCDGSNGGTSSSCSAPLQSSTSGNPPTGVEAPGPSQALFNNPFYTCLRNFYVATNGNDANDGTTPSTPWATIQHADTSARTGGDCINVAPGTYQQSVLIHHGGIAPTSTGYVVYRCQTMNACHILAPGGGHLWGFANAGNFVVVDGFELDGNNSLQTDGVADTCIGTDDATYGRGNSSYQAGASSHHLWVLNNIIHHCNLSGVTFNNKEWFYTIHNTVYHNSWTSGYQGSGIGYVVVQCIEASGTNCYTSGIAGTPSSGYDYTPSGNDVVFNPPAGYYPFHNVVAWNVVYNNRLNYNNPVGCANHTDGNGIIMDTFLDGFSNTLTYPYQTLVMNNVSYFNGGRGIHVFASSTVTVANNTAFNNNTDTCLAVAAYVNGDLSQQGGANNVWINNASKSVANLRNNTCALLAGNGRGVTDTNNSYNNNVLSTTRPTKGNPPCVFDNDVTYFACSSNKCNTDPGFVNATAGVAAGNNGAPIGGTWIPGNSNFAITTTSPAYSYAKPEAYLPSQNTDAGACSHALTTCPNPGTSNY